MYFEGYELLLPLLDFFKRMIFITTHINFCAMKKKSISLKKSIQILLLVSLSLSPVKFYLAVQPSLDF